MANEVNEISHLFGAYTHAIMSVRIEAQSTVESEAILTLRCDKHRCGVLTEFATVYT